LLIAFEGLDGAGKSTQIALLKSALEERGLTPTVVREPGGTQLGERIRSIVLAEDMCPESEALLMAAARTQLYHEIKDLPIVLTDRWIYSSLIYQGFARGLGLDFIRHINPVPPANLLFLLDLPLSVSLKRMGKLDRIEQSGLDFYRKVAEGYQTLRGLPECITLDATLPPDQLHSKILSITLDLLKVSLQEC